MILFKDCDLVVGTTGILAANVSLDMRNNLQSNYCLGYRGASFVPNGNILSAINFDYIFNIVNDPFLGIINGIRSHTGFLQPIQVEFAGLEFSAYLQNFNLSIEPNNSAKASAAFVSYLPHSGQFSQKRGVVKYNRSSVTIGHGFTSYITSSGTYLSVPTYGFNYSYNATFNPIFSIGNLNPIQVYFSEGVEEVEILRDEYVPIVFSGDYAKKAILSAGTEKSIELFALNYGWDISSTQRINLDLRNYQVNSNVIRASPNESVKVAINIQQLI